MRILINKDFNIPKFDRKLKLVFLGRIAVWSGVEVATGWIGFPYTSCSKEPDEFLIART